MKKRHKSWKSPCMGKSMDLLIYGTEGTPVIIFPTAHGDYTEWENHGGIDAIAEQVEEGYNQVFCVDGFAGESFLNAAIEPIARINRFSHYQSYLMDELLPFISDENSNPYIITTGVAIGAYCALLMALKYPTNFQKVIGLCGYYDIRVHMDEFFDDNVYFNNPVEFIPNLNDEKLLKMISNVDIRLLNYLNDPNKDDTQIMSDLMWMKFIEHEHYVWNEEADNMWDLVPRMLKDNLF